MLPFTRHLKKVPKPPVYQDSQLRAVYGEREVLERQERELKWSVRNPGGGTAETTPTGSSTGGVGRGGSQKPALEMMGWCSAQWLWVGGEGVHGGTIHIQGLPGSPNLACPSVGSISFGKKMF